MGLVLSTQFLKKFLKNYTIKLGFAVVKEDSEKSLLKKSQLESAEKGWFCYILALLNVQ